MTNRGSVLAAAAAVAFVMGAGGSAMASHHETKAEKIHCDGVNACKGMSECKTAESACGGQNSCKGKGWVSMTDAECEAAKQASKAGKS